MKYPRTYHLPDSPGIARDDKVLRSTKHLVGKRVVITEKLDGENTSMLRRAIHARSENSQHHPSQSWVKGLHNRVAWQIPQYTQIVGENVYARHSIFYDRLTSYFYGFAVIDLVREKFFPFADTLGLLDRLEIPSVPILYRGEYDPDWEMPEKSAFGDEIEGYVIRLEGEFPVKDIRLSMAKWVRAGHVQTDEHWRNNWTPNLLRSSK